MQTRSARVVLTAASAAQVTVSFVNFGLPAIGPQLRDEFGLGLPGLGAVLTAGFLGSGLSLLNRVSPKTLTEVLSYAYENRIIASDFIDSLPIAGVDGTLKKRFRESDVQGRVMAKTGYLNNVRALSGYVFTKQGDVLVFSILDNGLGWKTKEFQSSLLSELVGCCGAGVAGNPTIN